MVLKDIDLVKLAAFVLNEMRCVEAQDGDDKCDRQCQNCPLVMPTDQVMNYYRQLNKLLGDLAECQENASLTLEAIVGRRGSPVYVWPINQPWKPQWAILTDQCDAVVHGATGHVVLRAEDYDKTWLAYDHKVDYAAMFRSIEDTWGHRPVTLDGQGFIAPKSHQLQPDEWQRMMASLGNTFNADVNEITIRGADQPLQRLVDVLREHKMYTQAHSCLDCANAKDCVWKTRPGEAPRVNCLWWKDENGESVLSKLNPIGGKI